MPFKEEDWMSVWEEAAGVGGRGARGGKSSLCLSKLWGRYGCVVPTSPLP